MPHFGPHNVIWHSTPGDLRYQTAIITGPGDPRENGMPWSLPIGNVMGGPLTTLVVMILVPGGGGNFQGIRSTPVYTASGGAVQTLDWVFGDVFCGGYVWQNVTATGGTVDFLASTSTLNFITGLAVNSVNGFALGMLIDPQLGNIGDPTIATMIWDSPVVRQTGSSLSPVSGPIPETVTRTGIFNPPTYPPGYGPGVWLTIESLTVAISMATAVGSLDPGANPGWSEVVADHLTGFIGTGSGNPALPPPTGDIMIYDNFTDPRDDTMTWTCDVNAFWITAAASLRYPASPTSVPGGIISGSSVQFVG